jgi:hypothetical protein
LLVALQARAQSHGEGQLQAPGEFRLHEENDVFNPFGDGTDLFYTQGLRAELLNSQRGSDEDFLPGISRQDWCSLFCGKDFAKGSFNTGYAVGQNIYTPADITIAAPQPNDRPWGGLLYGSRIARVTYVDKWLKAQRQDRIEVSLGIVGPAALAKEAQTFVHHVIDVDRPEGWDNQLKTEPVLQLRYETALRWPEGNGGNTDFIARARGHLGNAFTSVEADVTWRIGWNLSGFGVQAIPATRAAAVMGREANGLTDSGWRGGFNLFARAGMKAVAHNIFLDGNSFASNDIRIERNPFVVELAGGVEMNVFGNIWASFQFIHRGSEFRRRNGRDAPPQQFGAITFGWNFGGEPQ